MIDTPPQPATFFSKEVDGCSEKYSVHDRELLTAHFVVVHFRHHLQGRSVVLLIDHKPVVSAFGPSSLHVARQGYKSDRQQRHWAFIAVYIADVQCIQGAENVVTK